MEQAVFGSADGASKKRTGMIVAVVVILVLILVFMMYAAPAGSNFRADRGRMSVGAHWGQAGTYGHTGSTLGHPHEYSGYAQTVPAAW